MSCGEPPGAFVVHISGGTPFAPNTAGAMGSFGPTVQPLTGTDLVFPSTPNVACALGHRASVDDFEYLDGEVISRCLGCGERIIFARVHGGVNYARVKALVGTAVDISLGGDSDLGEALAERVALREALTLERAALSRAEELLAIAEHHLQQRLAEAA